MLHGGGLVECALGLPGRVSELMTDDLELTVLQPAQDECGYLGSFAITERAIYAVGGLSSLAPTLLVSSDGRDFARRVTPRELGLRDVRAIGDALWVCGEYGQLAVSRDRGGTWKLVPTGTTECLFGLAVATDGALWVVGDRGFAARVSGEQAERVASQTDVRLSAVFSLRDEMLGLGGDGGIRRWRAGAVSIAASGSSKALTGFVRTRDDTWVVVGDAGFVSRSPDGAWFTVVKTDVTSDFEAVAMLADGRIVIVGDHGTVLVSADDGRHWTTPAIAPELGDAHLWSIAAYRDGALVGGDRGLIARLGPRT